MEKLDYEHQEKWSLKSGKLQSPIYFRNDDVEIIKENILQFNQKYEAISMENKLNNLSMQACGSMCLNDVEYQLQEVHLHHLAEHGFEDERELRPLEMHFVHRNKLNRLLVIAITFKFGEKNSVIQALLDGIERNFTLEQTLDLTDLIPEPKHYFRYLGSMTTPPLTEGVEWIVFEEPQELNVEQLHQYVDTFKNHNNRNFQKINLRRIQKYIK